MPQSDLEAAAHLFGEADSACILYGMGITQHTTGTDNVKSVANLLLLTGNIGREGTGFSPLRGQNNVQGACDMGALPNVYPGYQQVNDPLVRAKSEAAWGCQLSNRPGVTVTEIADAIYRGDIKGLYVMGENPMLSEPHLKHTERAFEQLEFLVVQDIFLSETAWLADVILPAAAFAEKDGTFTSTERRVQRITQALLPPGEAKADWQIISALSEKMGQHSAMRALPRLWKNSLPSLPSMAAFALVASVKMAYNGLASILPTQEHHFCTKAVLLEGKASSMP